MSNPAKLQVAADQCITDASLTNIATGRITFLTTDNKDNPLPISVVGTAQAMVQDVSRDVANGSITGSPLFLINPAGDGVSPQNFRYRITVTDLVSNKATVYRNVLIVGSGASWDFKTMNAGLLQPAIPVSIVQGEKGENGAPGADGPPGETGPRGFSGAPISGTLINGTFPTTERNFFAVQTDLVTDRNTPINQNYEQADLFTQSVRSGFGWSFGGGNWSLGKALRMAYRSLIRGIHQGIFLDFEAYGEGDKAAAYFNMSYVGGPSAGSDEGVTCISGQAFEVPHCYHGTLKDGAGVGSVNLLLNQADSGFQNIFDGGILYNLSRSPNLAGDLTGYSQQLENFLNYLPVTVTAGGPGGGKLPQITAWAVCTDGPGAKVYPEAYGAEITRTVTLKPLPGGATPALVNGHARLCGAGGFEQVILYNVQPPSNGTQQVTFKWRVPNPNFYLFQSPISDTYISFDSRTTAGIGTDVYGQMSSYCVLGSLNGNDLIYANKHVGTVGWTIPYGDNSGAGACEIGGYGADVNGNRPFKSFHLYVGAAVIGVPARTDYLPSPEVEPNRIAWTVGDQLVCAHPASGGGGYGYWLKHFPQTPAKPGFAHANVQIESGGLGVSGYYGFLGILNTNPANIYWSNGGALKKPSGINIAQSGDDNCFRTAITIKNAPDPLAMDGEAAAITIRQENSYTNGREWAIIRLPYSSITYWLNSAANNPSGTLGGADNQRYVKVPFFATDTLRATRANVALLTVGAGVSYDKALEITQGRVFLDAPTDLFVHDGSNYQQGQTENVSIPTTAGTVTLKFLKGLYVGHA